MIRVLLLRVAASKVSKRLLHLLYRYKSDVLKFMSD